MNLQKLAVTVVVGALLIAGLVFPRGNTVVQQVADKFSASSGNEHFQTEYFYQGTSGVQLGFVSTTTSVCRLRNNMNATTTFAVNFRSTLATTTTTVLGVSTTTDAIAGFATSTVIASRTVPANGMAALSYDGTTNQNILGPGEWVMVGYYPGTTLGGVAQLQSGICNISFGAI